MKLTLNEEGYPHIRKLTLRDRKTLSGLIKKFAEKSGNTKLVEMIPGVSKQDTEEEQSTTDRLYDLITSIMGNLIDWVEEDVTEWFMEITGVGSMEEWEALPMDIEVYVLEELYAQKGFNNFFSKALGLYKKIQG